MIPVVGAKRIVSLGLLLGLSVVGAYVKLGPTSIAFDAAAGFTAALLLGPGAGAVVCAVGHLLTATVTGFPLSPAFHLLVAVAMAGVGSFGGLVGTRFGRIPGAIALILANGLGAPALLALVPNPLGPALFWTLAPVLTLAAGANAAVAVLAVEALQRSRLLP